MVPEVEASTFERLGESRGHRRAELADARPTRSSRSTSARPRTAPTRSSNPAVHDVAVRQAIAYAHRPRANQRDRRPRHLVRRERDPARVLRVVLRGAGADLPLRPGSRQPDPRRRGLGHGRRRRPREGRRDPLLRPLRALGVQCHDPDGEADRRADGRDRGRVQRAGGQHRQAHRADDPQGRRQAGARLRHLHLGLGRRPLRPELPAQHPHHRRDRRLLGLLLVQPRVRPALRGAGRRCSTSRRAET